jgi:hypothetical protein
LSPDRRKHRGAHPSDAELFASGRLAALRAATAELSWLLSRGYRVKSALKLVGDRHGLRERQRLAVARAACSDESLGGRAARRLGAEAVAGAELIVDGFNVVITAEAALSGAPLVGCRDGCVRDLSGVHGSYRAVEETGRAVIAAGETLSALGPAGVLWLFDRPVSNSGRLAARVRAAARERGWPWSVEVVFNPDREIAASDRVAVTSDSDVLDRARLWLNFNPLLVARHVARPWLVDLSA